MNEVIEVKDIETRFGSAEVHRGVSFTVKRATIFAVIGGSGSGKSVLLREIIGLLRPSAGSVKLLGTDMWASSLEEVEAVRHRFGVLFQNGALFSALTVGDNVALPLRERTALPDDAVRAIVDLRLALTGLEPDTALKMPSELSGGMRKRVALARALALEPEVVFLDEPTSGLDPINARAFDHLVRALCTSLGLTVVLVTHDLDTILSIVDQIVILDEGRVLADGPVAEVAALDDPWIKSYFSSRAA